MTGDGSDKDFTRRALRHLPAMAPGPGFEAAALAAYDGWNAKRSAGVAGALRGFCDLIWPGAPAWALAGGFAASLLAGVTLGAALPAPEEDRMAFSLDQTPGFAPLASDNSEDL